MLIERGSVIRLSTAHVQEESSRGRTSILGLSDDMRRKWQEVKAVRNSCMFSYSNKIFKVHFQA